MTTTARRLVGGVHSMLLEANGADEVNEILAGPMPQNRALEIIAMGGELA